MNPDDENQTLTECFDELKEESRGSFMYFMPWHKEKQPIDTEDDEQTFIDLPF